LSHCKDLAQIINSTNLRKYHKQYNTWKNRSSKRSSGSSGISGGTKKYSNKWWFWTKVGRKTWKECKAKGKDSPFWKENKCDTRQKPAKGSKWWWWTKTGRQVWKECKEKGDKSTFWKDNDCEAGRCVRAEFM
jgi:hypothetical protein